MNIYGMDCIRWDVERAGISYSLVSPLQAL